MMAQTRPVGRQSAKDLRGSPSASPSEPPSPTGDVAKRRARLRSGDDSWGSSPRHDESPRSPTSPTSPTLEEARRKRDESLSKALAKAEAAKTAAAQRQQELKVGEELSEMLKIPANRRDPEKLAEFWEEVKLRLLKKFGSLHTAMHSVSGGDGAVSFLNFGDLLRMIHLPLNQSTCRAMFDKVCSGNREIPVDAFKALLMEKTIQAMRFVMENWNGKQARVKSHIRNFVRRLAETGETNLNRAVDRFQRKLTTPFLRSFWQLILKRLGGSRSEDVSISRPNLLKILQDTQERNYFQSHELLYMLRIFERVSSYRASLGVAAGSGVSVSHFLTGLVLVSPIQEAEERIGLIFESFDNDYDSCLLYGQIHDMCHCICVLKPMAEESSRGAEDEQFQAELSQQEGQRIYECIRWYLQRSANVQGDIVSLPELWASLRMQPSVLQALLPGLTRVRWAAKAVPGEDLEEVVAAAAEDARQTAMGTSTLNEENKGATAKRPNTKGGSQTTTSSRRNSKWSTGQDAPVSAGSPAGAREKPRSSAGTPPSTGGSAAGKWREPLSTTTDPALASQLTSDQQFQKGSRAGLTSVRSESTIFKNFLASKFSKSLRDLGDRRLAELTSGFRAPEVQLEDLGSAEARPDSPAAMASSRSVAGFETPNSKGGRTPGSMGRVSSSPSLGVHGASPDREARGLGIGSPVGAASPGQSGDLPVIGFRQQRWGHEAGNRFKIFAAAKTCGDRKDHMRKERPDPGQVTPYRCQLCFRMHKLCPGHDMIQ